MGKINEFKPLPPPVILNTSSNEIFKSVQICQQVRGHFALGKMCTAPKIAGLKVGCGAYQFGWKQMENSQAINAQQSANKYV